MKSFKLIGLTLGASLLLSTAALAQDLTVAVAGPRTGGESAFARQRADAPENAAVAERHAIEIADGEGAGAQIGRHFFKPKEDAQATRPRLQPRQAHAGHLSAPR